MDTVTNARKYAAIIMLTLTLAGCGQISVPDILLNDQCEYTYNVSGTFIDVPDEYGQGCTVIIQGDGNTIYTNPDVTVKDNGTDNQVIIKSKFLNSPVMFIAWKTN